MSFPSSSSASGDHYQPPGPGHQLTRDHSRGSTSASSTTSTLVAREPSPRLGGGFKVPWLATCNTAEEECHNDHHGKKEEQGWSIDIDASHGLLHEKDSWRSNRRRSYTAPFGGRRWGSLRRVTIMALIACAGFLALTCTMSLMAPGTTKDWSHKLKDGLQRESQQHAAAKTMLEPKWEWARNVSIVYTWVNGSDPHFRQGRKMAGGQVGGNRDRDNDDLKFSLRTLSRSMPWHTGKIYIVSPSPPTWALLQHDPWHKDTQRRVVGKEAAFSRLEWVHQDSILPRDAIPAFSSNVIEQYLHLVPGLTEHFIHVNDDYMFPTSIHPSDFFTLSSPSVQDDLLDDGTPQRVGVRQFLENSEIRLPSNYVNGKMKPGTQIWRQSVYNSVAAIQRAYGSSGDGGQQVRQHAPRWLKHAPFVYTRSAFFGIHSRFYKELRATSGHNFRNSGDVLTPLLIHSYVSQEGSHCCGLDFEVMSREEAAEATMLVKWNSIDAETDQMREKVREKINGGKLKFLTFNDEIGTGPATEAAQKKLKAFYEEIFGTEKSEFEK